MTSSCCVAGFLDEGTPKGQEVFFGEAQTPTYVVKPESGFDKAIVIATDVFGQTLPNIRLMADGFAEKGFLCLIPDMFSLDPVPMDIMDVEKLIEPPSSLMERAGMNFKLAWNLVTVLLPWLLRHPQKKSMVPFTAVLKDVQAKFPSVKKIGVLGFCYGGKTVASLGFDNLEIPESKLVSSIATAHPSLLDFPKDVEALTKPVLFNIPSKDNYIGPKEQKKLLDISGKKKAQGQRFDVYVYEDTDHGFAIRGGSKKPHIKKAREVAFHRCVEFFNETLL